MTDFRIIEKPNKEEYPEYSEMYMELTKDSGNILQYMKDNFFKIKKFIYDLPED